MKKIFVDTGAWIALADENDRFHKLAADVHASIIQRNIPLIITDYIFDETVTWLHYKIGHKTACEWGNKILKSRMIKMFEINNEHIMPAWELFQKYHDQKFSFTDCTSFVVIKILKAETIFCYDSHFSVMGFNVIGESPIP